MQVSAYDLQPSSPARNGRTQGFSVAAHSGATIGGGATGQRYQSAAASISVQARSAQRGNKSGKLKRNFQDSL
jgi:hypothetical protein